MNKHKRRISWIVAVITVGCLAGAVAQEVVPVAPAPDEARTEAVSEVVAPMPVITPGSEVMVEPLGEAVVTSAPAELSPALSEMPADAIAAPAMDAGAPVTEPVLAPEETVSPAEAPVTESSALPVEPVAVESAPVTEPAVVEQPLAEPAVESAPVTEPAVVEQPLTEPAVETAPVTEPAVVEQPLTEPAVETAPVTEPAVAEQPLTEPMAPAAPEVGSMAETSTVGFLVEPGSAEAAAAPAAVEPAPETNVTTELIELMPEGEGSETDLLASGAKENLISISLDNVPLQDVMRMFARISGANIVSGTNLQGNITVNLKDVEWQPALRTILDTAGMTLVMKSPGIYSVVSKADAAAEPVTIDTVYLKFTTVTNVLPVIQRMLLSSNASVAGFPAANALVLQETSERLDVIKEVVRQIDKPRPQVFIEAKFVELDDQAIKDIGVNWESLENYTLTASKLSWGITENRDWLSSRDTKSTDKDSRRHFDGVDEAYDVDGVQSLSPLGPPVSGDPGRSIEDTITKTRDVEQNIQDKFMKTVTDLRTAVMSAQDFQVTLSALKQQSGVSVVSNPRIVVASGETAQIHVGRKDPNYETLTESSSSGPVITRTFKEYMDTGVKVDVTPTVNTESNITIRIKPILTRNLPARSGTDPGDLPPISTREISSEFNLEAGRTVAIGGLTSTDDREEISKIPVLGDIPIIGKYLFRHTHTENVQSEVIIFVTVGMATPESITVSAGIPSEGKLIHRHLAQQAAGAEAAAKTAK